MSVFNPLTSEYSTQLFVKIGKLLYLDSESADVHFVFESNDVSERVPAHKAHLMAASDVFAKMFNGSWKENKEVKIADTPAAAFKEFLQFFYFGQVKLTMENVAAVMNLGEMYNVTECLAVCSKFLKNNLNDENVCRNYELATLSHQDDLKKACETVIGFNTKAVLKSSGFLTCDQKVLAEILKLNWLSCTEVELFEACMSWVKATVDKDDLTKELVQTILGDSFYDIRFGSMSFEEFGTLMPVYGHLFVGGEYADIIQMFSNKEFKSQIFNQNREKRFDYNPWKAKDKIFCRRLLSIHNSVKPYFIKNLETTKFSSNKPLLLRSFFFFHIRKYINGEYIGCDEFPTKITIVEVSNTDNSRIEVMKYDGNATLGSTHRYVQLPKPIPIKPGFMYEIRLEQNPPENCATGALLKSKVQLKDDIVIQFHDHPKIPDFISPRGLIYYLVFYSA